MKTVAVLAALAAIATAVPAPPGYGYERYRPAQYRLPVQYRREKKSPQGLAIEAMPAIESLPALDAAIALDVPHAELDITPDMSARTFGLKKPIIVKKKLGYHLYRDSAEEMAQADSQEKCTKEVKVKLCDAEHLVAKSGDLMRSATEESSSQLADNDMKHSIKLAKEAVENLQKMTQFQNAALGPDAELHGDIEVARQALEHIQQNFGNLEAMNLQATTLSDAEAIKNAHFKIAQTGSERMAQWQEAIENIQKNAEIAKNIEDSFKSESLTKVPSEDLNKKMKSSEALTEEHHEASIKTKSSDDKVPKIDAPFKKNADQENLHEMDASASEHQEVKSVLPDIPTNAKEATPKFEDVKVEHQEVKSALPDIPTNAKEATLNFEDVKVEKEEVKSALPDISTNAKEATPKFEEVMVEHKEVKSALLDIPTNAKEATPKFEDVKVDHQELKSVANDIPTNAKEATPKFEDVMAEHKSLENDAIAENSKQGKSTELESSSHDPAIPMEKTALHEETIKEILPADKTKKTEEDHKIEQLKSAEKTEDANDLEPAQSVAVMKSVAPPPADNHRSANVWENNAGRQTEMQKEKSAWKDSNDMKIKSNENFPVANEKKIESAPHMEHGKTADLDNTSLMKAAELNQKQENLHMDETPFHGKEAHEMIQSTKTVASPKEQVVNIEHVPVTPLRSANLISQQGSIHDNNQQLLSESQGKTWHEDKMIEKSSEMFHGNPEFERDAHHHHMPGHMSGHASASSGGHAKVDFIRNHPGHLPPGHSHDHRFPGDHRFHGHQGVHHGKAAEADNMVQATSQMNVNDASGKAALGAARGAYGPGGYGIGAGGAGALSLGGAAGGPGAVGVFPGANIGGCAIPLLLSCSPSVVPGSLAKASYGAHAYRAGEDFNGRFHNKRDTKKTNEILTSKVNRNHNKFVQRIPIEKNL